MKTRGQPFVFNAYRYTYRTFDDVPIPRILTANRPKFHYHGKYTYHCTSRAVDDNIRNFQSYIPTEPSQLVKQYVDMFIERLSPVYAMPWEEVIHHLDLSTSAGTYYKRTKALAIQDWAKFVNHMTWWLHQPYDSIPCKIGTKAKLHNAGEDKCRVIWMYPIEQVMLESEVAIPIYQQLKTMSTSPMMFGSNTLYKLMLLSNRQHTRIAIDWHAFDQHVPGWLSYYILQQLSHKVVSYSDPSYTFDGRVWLSRVSKYFINTPVMLSDSTIIKKHNGIPSGSPFTQIVGSIANYAVVMATLATLGVSPLDISVLGDDCMFSLSSCPDYKNWIQLFGKVARDLANYELSPDKCSCYTDGTVSFIGYMFIRGQMQINVDKFVHKLMYSPEDYEIPRHVYRLIGLYAIGAWLIPGVLDWILRLPMDIAVDRNTSRKLHYVLGVDASPASFVAFRLDLSRFSSEQQFVPDTKGIFATVRILGLHRILL